MFSQLFTKHPLLTVSSIDTTNQLPLQARLFLLLPPPKLSVYSLMFCSDSATGALDEDCRRVKRRGEGPFQSGPSLSPAPWGRSGSSQGYQSCSQHQHDSHEVDRKQQRSVQIGRVEGVVHSCTSQ